MKKLILADESATLTLGTALAIACVPIVKDKKAAIVIHLHGDLGAGKTTLSRGFLRGLDFLGNVKSPTYTLVEVYRLTAVTVYHFDLYRLAVPEELEYIGIRDYFDSTCICLIEWPEKARNFFSDPDLTICLDFLASQRQASISVSTNNGQQILSTIQLNNRL